MDDLDNDFSQTFEVCFSELQVEVGGACAKQRPWPRGVVVAVHAAFAYAAREPGSARVLSVESLRDRTHGPEAAERLIATFAEQLRQAGGDLLGSERVTERALIGGLLSLVRRRVSLGKEAALPALAAEAVQFLLIPCLGAEQARRVAAEQAD